MRNNWTDLRFLSTWQRDHAVAIVAVHGPPPSPSLPPSADFSRLSGGWKWHNGQIMRMFYVKDKQRAYEMAPDLKAFIHSSLVPWTACFSQTRNRSGVIFGTDCESNKILIDLQNRTHLAASSLDHRGFSGQWETSVQDQLLLAWPRQLFYQQSFWKWLEDG